MKNMEDETTLGTKLQVLESSIQRADNCVRMYDAIAELCMIQRRMLSFRHFDDETQVLQKKAIDTILADIKTMRFELIEMASNMADLKQDLEKEKDNE